ncbi:hypothetical protein LP092_15170 (plasmid) [Moraxella bovis]|uniref:Uncharacterized protein n=1 Tax=Moraxella bovis TaxID=476 RepID=A0ABY6MEL2_MORBO|nr:hypothetical protein [Moraxella bovis]UZA04816.1 hypothetical protein LP092_15165 [Moraxella bovis]UZA04817.1 hypothetical protein LP092_15170 [Moraxella bovis]
MYGNNGTFKDIKDILADLQIERLSLNAKLSLDMPPPKQNTQTFDDHHTVSYDSGQVQSAKSLLAAITLSDADLKDPIKTTQKLLVRDIVESTFKAIGTEESLKFVQLLHATNPNAAHYKELGISGNQVNSVANRQAVFGALKELVGSEAFDVIQKHALTYGLHQKTLDKDENHLTAKRHIKHALQKIELPLHTNHQTHSMMIDPSVIGEANKLMQNLSNFGHLDKSVVRSRLVGRYPQTMLVLDESNLHRVFDTALSRLKAGIEVSDDILKEAINARASYDDSFKLTVQMIDRYGSPNHLTIQNPKYTLETMSDDQMRVVDELSSLAMVKLAWSSNEKTAYHKHQSFEAVINLIKDTQTDKGIWQVLSNLQKSNDTLKAVANNQQAEGSQVNLLANQHQTMDFNKEQTFSI